MMKLGMFLFDVLSLVFIAGLWGLSIWSGLQAHELLAAHLWAPLAIVASVLVGLLALILYVGVIHHILPRVKPGRYPLLSHPMFFIWVFRFILQRTLFAPGLKVLLFQFNTLRWLSLRALGAKVSYGANMSSDATILDPWLLEVAEGATIGTGCLVSGHFVDRGELVLGRVVIGEGCLLAARVIVAPGTRLGKKVRALAGVMMGVGVEVGDKVIIGPDSRLESGTSVASGVVMGASTFLHKKVSLDRDTEPLEVIHPPAE